MSGFISGADRSQGTMFPAQLEDYVAEDNPVRVIDCFVDRLDLRELGFSSVDQGDGKANLPSRADAEDLCLRLSQTRSIEPPARAGVPAQRRGGVADGLLGSGLQDHRRSSSVRSFLASATSMPPNLALYL